MASSTITAGLTHSKIMCACACVHACEKICPLMYTCIGKWKDFFHTLLKVYGIYLLSDSK